jgi:hypothetical protein
VKFIEFRDVCIVYQLLKGAIVTGEIISKVYLPTVSFTHCISLLSLTRRYTGIFNFWVSEFVRIAQIVLQAILLTTSSPYRFIGRTLFPIALSLCFLLPDLLLSKFTMQGHPVSSFSWPGLTQTVKVFSS